MIRYKSIGVTGTRTGMTEQQEQWLMDFLTKNTTHVLHHGNCIGVDTQVAAAFYAENVYIIAHPGNIKSMQASYDLSDLVLPVKSNLTRNRDIVNCSDLLLAFPETKHKVPHSGTWYTIDYALHASYVQKKRSMLSYAQTDHSVQTIIIGPDGLEVKDAADPLQKY
jgi:hypothetical protein